MVLLRLCNENFVGEEFSYMINISFYHEQHTVFSFPAIYFRFSYELPEWNQRIYWT